MNLNPLLEPGWVNAILPELILSIGGFTVASALCGLSETLTQIVASRLLQGLQQTH